MPHGDNAQIVTARIQRVQIRLATNSKTAKGGYCAHTFSSVTGTCAHFKTAALQPASAANFSRKSSVKGTLPMSRSYQSKPGCNSLKSCAHPQLYGTLDTSSVRLGIYASLPRRRLQMRRILGVWPPRFGAD